LGAQIRLELFVFVERRPLQQRDHLEVLHETAEDVTGRIGSAHDIY